MEQLELPRVTTQGDRVTFEIAPYVETFAMSIELSIIKVVSFEHPSTLPKPDLASYRYNRYNRVKH